jgi:hypothetical protein
MDAMRGRSRSQAFDLASARSAARRLTFVGGPDHLNELADEEDKFVVQVRRGAGGDRGWIGGRSSQGAKGPRGERRQGAEGGGLVLVGAAGGGLAAVHLRGRPAQLRHGEIDVTTAGDTPTGPEVRWGAMDHAGDLGAHQVGAVQLVPRRRPAPGARRASSGGWARRAARHGRGGE